MGTSKLDYFKARIEKAYLNTDQYFKVLHMMLRARELHTEATPQFERLPKAAQYSICEITVLAHIHGSTAVIRDQHVIFIPEKKALKYNLEEGFEEPPTINIDKQRKLKE